MQRAWPITIFIVVRLVSITTAFAQDIVTDRDKYAASQFDPQRKAAGVDFEKMHVPFAVPACEDAVRRFPNSMRQTYQLGRAYEKTNQLAAAVPGEGT